MVDNPLVHRRNRRSAMFVPALDQGRIAAALSSGVDIVVFDLEDNTAEARKDEARASMRLVFQEQVAGPTLRFLRVNHPSTPPGLRDLAAVLDWTRPPDGLVVPKVESAAVLEWIVGTVGRAHPAIELMPIVETAVGLEAAFAIAAAPRVTTLLLGCDDLCGELGSDRSWDALAYARGRIAVAAAAAGVEAMDGPWRDPEDNAGLVAETKRVAALGFAGKASYFPGQVPHIHAAFTPTPDEIAKAERIVSAADADRTGQTHVDGQVVNAAVLKDARRLLVLAARRGMR